MHRNNFKRTKFACHFAFISTASAFTLPPILFATFHDMYNISYTLLGTLVLVNFCTQLILDLIFSFFTKYFNIKTTIRIMPILTSLGLITYAIVPHFFPHSAYLGLVLGTVIFSASAGLGEVLLSPVVAALPSDNPEGDMSFLHSLYGYGVVFVILISTLFFSLFGTENWLYLALFFAVLPLITLVLFCTSPIPDLNLSGEKGEKSSTYKKVGIMLCFFCIFLGGATENSMTNWIPVFMETALGIPKAIGDILGLSTFAILLAVSRTVYAKYGKNIEKFLLLGMVGATCLYIVAGLSTVPILSMLACILTGIATSMLWPGTLILMEEKIPNPGVAAYALMAAGGDFGSSVAPQLLGKIADNISASEFAQIIGGTLALSPEQIGLKAGMLIASIFPLLGVFLLLYMKKYFKKH
ncbi:MAG: MFS transporter [Clostridia bacterium]|nr:MFS transporter [Clostridia bacterium]